MTKPKREVGIRELKANASEILSEVREAGASYLVTHRGRRAAILRPVDEEEVTAAGGDEAWDEFFAAGLEVDRAWQSPRTAARILSGLRR